MDVFESIRRRRTIRDFKPDPVPDDVVHRILQAARWAPSSSNTQPWHFIVVRNPDTIAELGSICTQGTFIGQAPLAIAVVMGETRRPQLDAGPRLAADGTGGMVGGLGNLLRRHPGRAAGSGQNAAGHPRRHGTDYRAALRIPHHAAGGHRHAAQADVGDNARRAVRGGADVRIVVEEDSPCRRFTGPTTWAACCVPLRSRRHGSRYRKAG